MDPFVLGFLTKCAKCGLTQDQALGLLKMSGAISGAGGSTTSTGPSSASTGSSSMGPSMANKSVAPSTSMPNNSLAPSSSIFPSGVDKPVVPGLVGLNVSKAAPAVTSNVNPTIKTAPSTASTGQGVA